MPARAIQVEAIPEYICCVQVRELLFCLFYSAELLADHLLVCVCVCVCVYVCVCVCVYVCVSVDVCV